MKQKKLTLLSITVLATLLISAFTINTIFASTELELYVRWFPSHYNLNRPVPRSWTAILLLYSPRHQDTTSPEVTWSSPKNPQKINLSTILLEGTYQPISTHRVSRRDLVFVSFNGQDVFEAIMTKVQHFSPGKCSISLEITARTYDGTPCRGSGTITLII